MSDPRPLSRALALGLGLLTFLAAGLPAQDPGKKPAKEEVEESKKKDAKKPVPRVEEEEKGAKKKGVPKVEDDVPADGKAAAPRVDLAREAAAASNPVARALYQGLATPYDVITLASGNTRKVGLVAEYVGPRGRLSRNYELATTDQQGKFAFDKNGKSVTVKLTPGDVQGVDPYERIALRQVEDFLKTGLDQEAPASARYLARGDMLRVAEKALLGVEQFHAAARASGGRQGTSGWNEVVEDIHKRLRQVRVERLRAHVDKKEWDAAFQHALALAETYPDAAEVQKEVAQLLVHVAQQSVQNKQFAGALRRLKQLEERYPSSPALEPIRDTLRKEAEARLADARALARDGKSQEALEMLERAESVWPQLPGLRDAYLQVTNRYPTLYIGARDLPREFSPQRATTTAEKMAVELLFESLLRLVPDPRRGQRYESALAADLPQTIPLGRRFLLSRNAAWARDGRPVTAADLRYTMSLLKSPNWPGRNREWGDLVEDVQDEGSAFEASVRLRQGFIDPLALMNFKILPQAANLNRPDDPAFSQNPSGSGPYQLRGLEGDRVVLVANPHYSARPGKTGLPRIREVHFFRPADPAAAFKSKARPALHLLTDLSTRDFKRLRADLLADVHFHTLKNRRVYFLAVNHRRTPLQNPDLRKALAHALDRDAILNQCFRAETPDVHQALTGPYPADSWASKSGLKFETLLAKAHADKARQANSAAVALTLKYPAGDPEVKAACALIQQQVRNLGPGLELDLQEREAHQLRREVEEHQQFDLAYYALDYASDAYWLSPLLDPNATGPGEPNYLGYKGDAELTALFRQMQGVRELGKLQTLAHRVHEIVHERLPFIPLWQLDTHVAYHQALQPEHLDPLVILSGVERWQFR